MVHNLCQKSLKSTSKTTTSNIEHELHCGHKPMVRYRDKLEVCKLCTASGVTGKRIFLFGREIRAKLPGLEELRSAGNDSEVLDKDRERKKKGLC